MRNVLVLAVAFAMIGFTARFVLAEDKPETVKMTGTVIDQMCAKKMAAKDKPQEAADKHDKACCLKCGADAGYAIMSDGKTTNLTKDSSDKVKEYLSKDDAKTMVTIEGTKQADGSVMLSSISAAEEKK
jgi:hypothetical protein